MRRESKSHHRLLGLLLCGGAIAACSGEVGPADGPPTRPERRADGGSTRPRRDGSVLPPMPEDDASIDLPTVDGGPDTPPPPSGGPPATCTDVSGSFGGLTMIGCAPELDDPEVPRPLVVALHGYTQSARDYLATTEWDVLAGRYGFYVLFAQTPGNRSFDWFTAGRGRSGEDPMAIVAMVDRMKETYAIDDDRVFVTGLSAGGYMTVSLLADYPDVFAAGATFSGGPHGCSTSCMSSPPAGDARAVESAYPTWWADASRRRPRLMIVHGTTDGVVSFSNLDSTLRQWTGALGIDDLADNDALGLPAELKEHGYSVYADGDTPMIETHTLEGFGHGTPVDPGEGIDEGGSDPSPAAFDWTIATTFYGAYYAARFFGIAE